MGKFIFIVGGARSGKSRHAQELAKKTGGKVALIATCLPKDKEMKKRVALHKKSRPRHWKIIEEPKDIKFVLDKLKNKFDTVILDCIGLLISNFLLAGLKQKLIEKEIASIAAALSRSKFTSIVVSNEVGDGIVPTNALAREFRDLVGLANQRMARKADEVIVMHCGIPTTIKGA